MGAKFNGVSRITIGLSFIASDALSGLAVASEWERMLEIRRDPEKRLTDIDGFFLSVSTEVDCICSDSAGVNRKAREIVALRNPGSILIPYFAHESALVNGDLIRLTDAARIVPDCLHLVNFFNASSNKWSPRLREAMRQTGSVKFALVASVVTTWISVWLCNSSLLRAQNSFRFLLASIPDYVDHVLESNSQRLASLKRCFKRIDDRGSWKKAEKYLWLLVPSIEASLVFHGSDAPLGDVMYTKFCH